MFTIKSVIMRIFLTDECQVNTEPKLNWPVFLQVYSKLIINFNFCELIVKIELFEPYQLSKKYT